MILISRWSYPAAVLAPPWQMRRAGPMCTKEPPIPQATPPSYLSTVMSKANGNRRQQENAMEMHGEHFTKVCQEMSEETGQTLRREIR